MLPLIEAIPPNVKAILSNTDGIVGHDNVRACSPASRRSASANRGFPQPSRKTCNKACLCGILCCIRCAHKGLQRLAERDDARLVPQHLNRRIRRILTELAAAQSAQDMELPGYRLHPLKGERRGQWSVRVSGNWRIVFRFVEGEAVDVDLIDYH